MNNNNFTKNVTQGGQVATYMIRMFIQINNIISFYLILFYVLVLSIALYFRLNWQTIHNASVYFWVKNAGSLVHKSSTTFPILYENTTLRYVARNLLKDPFVLYSKDLFINELIITNLIAFVCTSIIAVIAYRVINNLGKKQSQDDFVRGRLLSDKPKEVAKLMKSRNEASDLKIDDLPLKKDAEIQNIAMLGTVATGKTTTMNKLLVQLRKRGDKVIIYDKGCTFVEKFYNPETDHLLNPHDERCENWDLWGECPSQPDYDTISNNLIPMPNNTADPFWQGSARTIFSAVASRMKKSSDRSYTKLLKTLLAIDLKELRKYVQGTEATGLLDEKVEKTAISIRSVLTNYVKAFRYLQGIDKNGKEKFTIREWLRNTDDNGKNGWLFITSNARQHESLKPIISMWLAIATNALLSMGENRNRRVWFFIDEIPSLHKLVELPAILAEARKFGGCFILGFQSFAQLEETYGTKYANAMMDLMNTRYFFRSPSAEAAKWVAKEIGEKGMKVYKEQYSYGADTVRDGVSFGKEEKDIQLVSYTDVQKMADLNCFVTMPGDYPAVRMAIKYVQHNTINEGITLRFIEDFLDKDIEEELKRREINDKNLENLLSSLETDNQNNNKITSSNKNQAKPTSSNKTTIFNKKAQTTSAATVTESSGRNEELLLSDGTIINQETGEITSYENFKDNEEEILFDELLDDEKNIIKKGEDYQSIEIGF